MEPFIFNSTLQLLICSACKQAVPINRLGRHLRELIHVQDAEKTVRRWLDGLGATPIDFEQLTWPPDAAVAQVDGLRLIHGAFQCALATDRCRRIYRTLNRLKRHLIEEHGWRNPQKVGYTKLNISLKPGPWRAGVSCQQLVGGGPFSQLFEVVDAAASITPFPLAAAADASTRQRMLDDQARSSQLLRQMAVRGRSMVAVGGKLEVHAWVDRNEWAVYLQGKDRQLLRDLVRPANEDEPVLRDIISRFREIVDVAQQTVLGRVNSFVRFVIEKKEVGKDATKPFHARIEADTMSRYKAVFAQLLCFVVRTFLSSQDTSDQGSSDQEQDKKPPEYKLTEKQRDLLDVVTRHVREQQVHGYYHERDEELPSKLDVASRGVLAMLVELFDHDLDGLAGNEFQSCVIGGLAVMAVREDDAWEGPLMYTPKLAAVVKIMRFLVVQQAYERATDDPGINLAERVAEMVDGFLTRSRATPMKWILDTKTYGFKIRYTTIAEGTIHWVGETVHHRDVRLSCEDLRAFVHGLVDQARQQLSEKVLLAAHRSQVPDIPWAKLLDYPSNTEPDWCFVHDGRNSWPVDGSTWLHARIWQSDELRAEFIQDGDEPWRPRRVEQWIRDVVRFKELLLLLMHVTGGQPARGPEMLSVRYRNTPSSRRSIFVEGGLMVFVTEYHKGYAVSGSTKVIYRYLPREVGELLLYFIWLVIPLQHRLEAAVFRVEQTQPFLFGGGRSDVDGRGWSTDRLKKLLGKASQEAMGVRLTVSSYRQICIAISRRYLGRRGFDTGEDEAALAEQEEDEQGQWWSAGDDIIDVQAGHGTHIAGAIYARGIEEASDSIFSVRVQFRLASERWHRLLGFTSTASSSGHKRGLSTSAVEAQRQARLEQLSRLRRMNIFQELNKLLGAGAEFRGVQQAAITAVTAGESRVLAVMGTGAGKSLMFMLPAVWEGARTTVVVVPMVALRADMRRRCGEAGISCLEWDGRFAPAKSSSIILVTPEAALTKGFRGFVNRLNDANQLDRIVIDECHVVLDSTAEFRPKILELREFMAVGCQVLLLTATLPPVDVKELFTRLGIEGVETSIFRAPTCRRNVEYRVLAGWDGSAGAVCDLVRRTEEEIIGECGEDKAGKTIVYARTKSMAQAVAEKLKCPFYHSEVAATRKEAILKELTSSDCRVVVATNALGVGIDVPDIRAVVHAGAPDSLRQYGQESGRAGRDGVWSLAVVLSSTNKSLNSRPPSSKADGQAMESFLWSRLCRRSALDEYLDGRLDRVRCEGEQGEVLCDYCKGQSRGDGLAEEEAEDKAEIRQQLQRESSSQEVIRSANRVRIQAMARGCAELERAISEWAGKCSICYSRSALKESFQHSTVECRAEGAGAIQREIMRLGQEIRYAQFSCCFSCGLPQWICQKGEESSGGGGWGRKAKGNCRFGRVLIEVVMAGSATNEAAKQGLLDLLEEEGIDYTSAKEVYRWFGMMWWIGGKQAPKIAQAFMVTIDALDL